METRAPVALPAVYFDGVHGKGHAVTLYLNVAGLRIVGDGLDRTVALNAVQWPERTRHGMRIAHLEAGGAVQCADSAAWDDWSHAAGLRDTLVVRLQQSWRGVLASVLALVALIVVLQQWGVPVAARAIIALTPRTVDAAVGDSTFAVVDARLMQPSTLPAQQAQQLRDALSRAVASLPPGTVPPWQLVFRSSKMGPNALALPNGTIILTDEMVQLVEGDEAVLVGILAHELGHVRHRHGMRMLVQVAALGTLASVVVGDFSSLLASVPVWLGQASYSRQAEQEADAMAVQVLRSARLSPAVMVTLFDKLAEWRKRKAEEGGKPAGSPRKNPADTAPPDGRKAQSKPASDALSWLGIAFASHPADAERVRFFQDAAGGSR